MFKKRKKYITKEWNIRIMNYQNIYQQYMYSYPHKTAYRQIDEIALEQYKPLLFNQKNSLYFHIPFCESKCGYCNLFSVTGHSEDFFSRYLDACQRQVEQYAMQDISFADLIIGGGTPLLLSEKQLERLFMMANKGFKIEPDGAVVIETAPNQTTWDKLYVLKENNVSRVSIGVQSFCEDELSNLCRHHSVKQAREAIKLLKKAEFSCLNIDLIYGIKGQTLGSLRRSLDEAVSYEPDEIFIYPLYIKPGTILDIKQEAASEKRYEFYCFIRDYLLEKGFYQTSMRRFVAKKSKETVEKNATDCGFENTISIGCGGRSYIGNLHFCTRYGVSQQACQNILKDYISCEDYTKISYGYLLSDEEIRRRYVIKNILTSRGIFVSEYMKKFNSNIFEDYDILQSFIDDKHLLKNGDRLYLSEEGLALSDAIGPLLISEEVSSRMKEWKE